MSERKESILPVRQRSRLTIWRVFSVLSIITAWFLSLLALPTPLLTGLTRKGNISNNSLLLESLNLSNYTVNCPQPYVFSPSAQKCSLECGRYDIVNPHLQYFRVSLLAILALINLLITILAVIRWIIIRKQTKFQHHPIIIGVVVNLIEAVTIGSSDLLGGNIFYCNGEGIDYHTFNSAPSIQLQIQGGLITFLGTSNSLWFTTALVLILLSVCYPMSDLFGSRRNRIFIVLTEISVCVLYPLITTLLTYVTLTGYELSEEILLPYPADVIIYILCWVVPHILISPITLTVVVVIVYKIQCQMQLVSKNICNQQKVEPLEKRLMFFSVLYFLLNLVIIISFMTKSYRDNFVEEGTDNYLAFVTLQSTFQSTNSVTTTGTNKTLSLLSPTNQLLVESADKPLAVYAHGIGIRMEFILVLSVLNFSCQTNSCKKNTVNQDKHTKV